MTESLGIVVQLGVPFAMALERTRTALKTEGFGVLAYRALTEIPAMGLLLPCNATVEADGAAHAVVRFIDPLSVMASEASGASPVIREVARDAQQRLERAAQRLRGTEEGQ